MVLCTREQEKELIGLLQREPLLNTFILADIQLYGFDSPFQKVWVDRLPAPQAVYLVFYDILCLYAQDARQVQPDAVRQIVQENKISCMMGPLPVLQPLLGYVPGYQLNQKVLCGQTRALPPQKQDLTQVAQEADVDDIHAFLNSMPEFDKMYASRDMIAHRITSGDGVHLAIRQEGSLIAHGNTAATSDFVVMIGGIATHPAHRGQGYARQVVNHLCQIIHGAGKTPATLCTEEQFARFYVPLGFEKLADWGMFTKE